MGQEGRNHRPLTRSPVIYRDDPVLKDARLEPFADQADDALVADVVFQEADQPVVVDAAEGSGDTQPVSAIIRIM